MTRALGQVTLNLFIFSFQNKNYFASCHMEDSTVEKSKSLVSEGLVAEIPIPCGHVNYKLHALFGLSSNQTNFEGWNGLRSRDGLK